MRGRLEIVEAVTEVNGRMVHGTPKTHQERSVPVPAFLRDALDVHIAGRDPDALVFTAAWRSASRRQPPTRKVRPGGQGRWPGWTRASRAASCGCVMFGEELDAVADRIDAAARASADFSRTSGRLNVVTLAAG